MVHCGLLLCHFRDVTPRPQRNNAVADGCCAGGHLESPIDAIADVTYDRSATRVGQRRLATSVVSRIR